MLYTYEGGGGLVLTCHLVLLGVHVYAHTRLMYLGLSTTIFLLRHTLLETRSETVR
jgi:hypothetical protein